MRPSKGLERDRVVSDADVEVEAAQAPSRLVCICSASVARCEQDQGESPKVDQ